MAKTFLETWLWQHVGPGATGKDYDFVAEHMTEQGIEQLKKMGIEDPNAIQPADESFDCCLCGRHFDGEYSHNAAPVKDGRCCLECNQLKVLPARLKDMGVKID